MATGPLKNARQEAFAQNLVSGMSAIEAYTEAGYAPDRGAATRLSANVSVRERVTALQERTATKVVVTKQWVIEQLVSNAQDCMKTGEVRNPSAANKALELLGTEIGMFTRRHQHSGAVGTYDLTNLTDAELEHLEGILSKVAPVGGDQSGEGETEG